MISNDTLNHTLIIINQLNTKLSKWSLRKGNNSQFLSLAQSCTCWNQKSWKWTIQISDIKIDFPMYVSTQEIYQYRSYMYYYYFFFNNCRRYGRKEVYADMLAMCLHCDNIFWKVSIINQLHLFSRRYTCNHILTTSTKAVIIWTFMKRSK